VNRPRAGAVLFCYLAIIRVVNLSVKIALPAASVTSIFQPSPGLSEPSISRSFSPQAVVASSQAALRLLTRLALLRWP
jgi:hypothetical protein